MRDPQRPHAGGGRQFPFLFGGTFIEGEYKQGVAAENLENFPSFSEGLSLRVRKVSVPWRHSWDFPSFSEGLSLRDNRKCPHPRIRHRNFPSFSEGLSLREGLQQGVWFMVGFPFLFGGTFIEGSIASPHPLNKPAFPFLFGGTFIEGCTTSTHSPPPH